MIGLLQSLEKINLDNLLKTQEQLRSLCLHFDNRKYGAYAIYKPQ